MTATSTQARDPSVQAAIDELSDLIRIAHPQARFAVRPHPEEPSTTLLEATVEIDDLDEVLDLVFDRMEQLRVDEGVPKLVVPLQPAERVAAMLVTSSGRAIALP